ncbi:MAG: L-serine ammonia-lyase, iron-sulfur-dependent, subunit alpha [Elusimicrobiota bacterium]
MDILQEILNNEVYPAFGCTEPISIAYACANASKLIKKIDRDITITLNIDPGTYKNGYGVNIPKLNNEKGNLIAAAVGALIPHPELKYNIFSKATTEKIKQAKKIIEEKRIKINVDYTKKDIYIEAIIRNSKDKAVCILSKSHFNISLLMLNDKIITSQTTKDKKTDYKEIIKNMTLKDLIELAKNATPKQLEYLKKGIEMNLKASKEGFKLKKTGYWLKKLSQNDVINNIKSIAASATDARMAGLPLTVMSSGQSGNQGIVAILVPYFYGKHAGIKEEKILKSIALSHIINSYIKSYTGELAPICGCAISSGTGASAAIVYQQFPEDISKIAGAINNVLADIGGLICDGAKESCSLKVASSVESAIKNAYLAINSVIVDKNSGFIEEDPLKTIKNMARLSIIGMGSVDSIIIEMMQNKISN